MFNWTKWLLIATAMCFASANANECHRPHHHRHHNKHVVTPVLDIKYNLHSDVIRYKAKNLVQHFVDSTTVNNIPIPTQPFSNNYSVLTSADILVERDGGGNFVIRRGTIDISGSAIIDGSNAPFGIFEAFVTVTGIKTFGGTGGGIWFEGTTTGTFTRANGEVINLDGKGIVGGLNWFARTNALTDFENNGDPRSICGKTLAQLLAQVGGWSKSNDFGFLRYAETPFPVSAGTCGN